MSTLYIAEISDLGLDSYGRVVPAPLMPPAVEQTVAIGGSSAQSNAFGSSTFFVQIHADTICSIAFGSSPTATTSNQRLAANDTRFYAVAPGQKVAVISNT
jgi:hypothetical protein